MRRLLLFVVYASANICFGQNVGIGTTTPQATLDVRGNQRIGGLSSYYTFDSATGRIEWKNASLYVPVSQFLLKHSAAGDGLYYNNTDPVSGQLEYRNAAGNPVFFTNFTNGRGYFSGDLGVGTISPGTRLHVRNGSSGYSGAGYFPGALVEGDNNTYLNLLAPTSKESGVLFGTPDDLAHGGIIYNHLSTIQGIQFRTGGNATRMTITSNGEVGIGTTIPAYKLHVNEGSLRVEGWGSNAATISMSSTGKFEVDAPFTPGGRFVIQENGHTGIGANNPAYRLDVSGRMRIRSGGSNVNSAGLWLNNNSNTEAAFLGMEDDTHVGFFGNSAAGWKFSMNTQTGALKVNGSEGANGQVLKSGGASAPTWTTLGNLLKTAYALGPSTETIITESNGWTELPPSLSITVDVKSRLVISGNFSLYGPKCSPCANGYGRFAIIVGNFFIHNSNPQGFATVFMEANAEGAYTISNIMYDVQPGTYEIRFLAIRNVTGNNYSMRSEFVSVMAVPID